jgi:putative transposase
MLSASARLLLSTIGIEVGSSEILEGDMTRHSIDPGRPVQNAFTESSNGELRDECLNQDRFIRVNDARRKIETWRVEYNVARSCDCRGIKQ